MVINVQADGLHSTALQLCERGSSTTIGISAAVTHFWTSWKNHSIPYPLVVINVNSPNAHGVPFGGNGSVSLETVVYELSPVE